MVDEIGCNIQPFQSFYFVLLFRVWDLEGNLRAYFVLRSPGMSVGWHPEDAFKVSIHQVIQG